MPDTLAECLPLASGDSIIAESERGIVPTLKGYQLIHEALASYIPSGGSIRRIGAFALQDSDGTTRAVASVAWGYEGDHDRTLNLDPGIWRALGDDPSATMVLEAMAGMLVSMPETIPSPRMSTLRPESIPA